MDQCHTKKKRRDQYQNWVKVHGSTGYNVIVIGYNVSLKKKKVIAIRNISNCYSLNEKFERCFIEPTVKSKYSYSEGSN